MKTTLRLIGIGLTGTLGILLAACNGGGNTKLETQKDKVSYIIGQNIGRSFKQQNLDSDVIDLDKLRAGIQDVLTGADAKITEEEMAAIMTAFQQDMMARTDSMNRAKGDNNKKAGEEFLAKNAGEEGVTVLPSGLQYKVIEAGSGKKPGLTSMVSVNYRGTLIDGTEFDSSYKRGQPATFPVNGVISGWTEALQLMPAGSKWMLYVPSALAYGDQAAGPEIGPNSTLIFEVELISVND
jgi:FKBP-type peptidyl-prolyl cis-trans isomerase FklB